MVNADELDLIEELLLGCAPGPDRVDRIGMAMTALRTQPAGTVHTVAAWILGALAAMLAVASQENGDIYRTKVRALMEHARSG
jgi:hypothetical protein